MITSKKPINGNVDYSIENGIVYISTTGDKTNLIYKWIKVLSPTIEYIDESNGTTNFAFNEDLNSQSLIKVATSNNYYMF
ncbi:MAG: hypothetical protein P8O04_00905 [Flavobacteriaceae bacterium]|mgnify:CR=1 FL=1|jgi:hypothetical protein|nr:hypothetical protein [Flavobacteriaceae bacterium]